MAPVLFPEWRDYHEPTKYPFADTATLANEAGDVLFPDLFLDMALYPVGGQPAMYLSKVVVSNSVVTIWFGDSEEAYRCYGSIAMLELPDEIRVVDDYGRPAGVLVSEASRLETFRAWGPGEHLFTVEQTGIVAACCMPTPELGVRGVLLDDGTVLTGDIYLTGSNGVQLNCYAYRVPGTCEVPEHLAYAIRVDVVGDPLWLRKACVGGRFATPQFVERIVFQQGANSVICAPNSYGDVKLVPGNLLAQDTILRIRPLESGLLVELVGERLENIR